MKTKISLTLATEQAELTETAIDVIYDLCDTKFYRCGHYRAMLNKLEHDRNKLLSFIA